MNSNERESQALRDRAVKIDVSHYRRSHYRRPTAVAAVLDVRPYTEEFFGNDNYGNPKENYIYKIGLMDDEKLIKETETMIFLSAFASNNPKSDYHWMCDVTYREWQLRGKVKNYEIAHANVSGR